ncbi:formylglycine-generating enzyme family protein [Achromobacter xylosoxidans]|uniref:formylglycine-generating enzyme family protein n=1 Tax=Achromobacter TaxID=222 RepID=UPI0006655CD8|nr:MULTISPECIES: SUMF1/EgtB/PvdO family nonheme iron enzyme [Achromobacter]PWY41903.1 hypothetical protein DK459_24180 [Achromobacter sp. RW408]CUR74933.1 Serine/threonine-protein kinase pkn1 [Achromobacter xylosoxidans]
MRRPLAAVFLVLLTACGPAERARSLSPDVSRLPPGQVAYLPPGETLRNGYPVSPAPLRAELARGVVIMTRQVSQAEYAACVRAGACKPLDPGFRDLDAPDLPAIGLSWSDASAYAAWLSDRSGQRWRLPTYAEWVYAAGDAYREETPLPASDADPAQRWLAEYDAQTRRGQEATEVRPFGAYGTNATGLMDMAGSVWEWTDDCYTRRILALTQGGEAVTAGPDDGADRNCGIRVAAGRHIAYLPDFIRDPKGGACSVGVPPANLGLRLVREDGPA